MTVEAYLRSLIVGLDLDKDVLTRAAYSPIEVGLEPFELEDDAYPTSGIDEEFQKRLDYAASTVYYSVLGVFAGGGYSEQVGDVRTSRSGFVVTADDRLRYKSLGDALRLKHNFPTDTSVEVGGMFDARYLRGK